MKKYDAVLFDLDGTLLPLDMDEFTSVYFGALAKYMSPYGYEAKPLVSALWAGVKEMVLNDGAVSNDVRFWDKFSELLGQNILSHREKIDSFYRNEFNTAKSATKPNPTAKELTALVREKFGRIVLATNPLFPMDGVKTRLSWIGLSPDDFEYVTTYENSHYCKPNPKYYTELAKKLNLTPEHCLMVGNDIAEDGAAAKAGFDVHIITDCLIGEAADLDSMSHSTFEEFVRIIKAE